MKKVTAIITTYNRLEYLKKAIESIEKQTYKDIEIIVVDDNSNDGTKEYCKSKGNIKYVYISKEEHKNGNYARNLGIQNSNGEYIAFLDDDDEWMESKIEKQVLKFEENKEYGVVYTGRLIEVNDGEFFYKVRCNKEYRGDCSKQSLYGVFSTTSTMMFSRDALKKVNNFDENVNFWQETELMIRISQIYKVGYIDEELVLYRQRFKDKKKLTNKIDGFIKNYEYINDKHKLLIQNLNEYEKKRRKRLFYQDLAERYSSLNENFQSRKYMFKIFLLFPSVKNFIKYLLNYTNYTKIKYKLMFKMKGKS